MGSIVEIQDPHTHFTVFDSMNQRSGYTHDILLSNRGFLFHCHEYIDQWEKVQAIGDDGSEFASLPRRYFSARLLFPRYFPWMTIFRGDTEEKSVYMKKQAFLTRDKFKNDHHASCSMQEIVCCEHISKTTHPNLARYLGVATRMLEEEQRVAKIAYKRYSMDLHNFVIMKRYLQPHHIGFLMHGIQKGMRHLHQLRLVHCDLRPLNVFVSIEDERDENDYVILKEVVIGDFDASVAIGESISLKRASKDWWPDAADKEWGTRAEEWIDEWCLEKLGKWLKEDGLGEWDFGGYGDGSWSQGSDKVLAGTTLENISNNEW